MTTEKPHSAFFRQSGWLMVANIAGGAMTWGVHFLAKKVPASEYAIFGALISLTVCIPTMPLQMVFSQQTAAGLATNRERQVAGMIRLAWVWTFVIWLVAAVGILACQGRIMARWQLPGPGSLWVTLPVLLFSLWLPMFSGVLQGQQNFFWMGWAAIVGGVCRLAVAAFIVLALGGGATGMMIGVLTGLGVSAIIPMWQTRKLWSMPVEPFDHRQLLSQVLPLIFGFGACQFMFSADTMFSKTYFGENEIQMASYVAAGTFSRALLWVVLPLAAVMFPKIVHSTARSEKNNLQSLVLLGTAVLGICGVGGLCVLGPWAVRIVYLPEYVKATNALLPWYAGAMVPLALANVMINNLLARSSFRVVPGLVVVAAGYGVALTRFHETPVMVLQTLGVFNVLLLAVCAWHTWRLSEVTPAGPGSATV